MVRLFYLTEIIMKKYKKQIEQFKNFENKINTFNIYNQSVEENIRFSKKIIIEYKNSRANLIRPIFTLNEPAGVKIYRNCLFNYLNGNYYAVLDGITFIEKYYQVKSEESNVTISKLEKSGQDSYSRSYYTLSNIISRLRNNNVEVEDFEYYLFCNEEKCLNLRNKFAHGEIKNNFNLYATYTIMSLSRILMRHRIHELYKHK